VRVELQMKLLYVLVLCRSTPAGRRRQLLPLVEAAVEEARRLGLASFAALGSHTLAILHSESESFDAAAEATLQSAEMSRGVDPATEILAIATTARCLVLIQRDIARAAELASDAQEMSARTGIEHPELPEHWRRRSGGPGSR
jgi:hypothetical protein